MIELHDTTHYLKLAYLAEVSIVFNLAYLELKQKDELKKLIAYIKSLLFTALTETENISCKNTRDCKNKCGTDNYLSKKFEETDSNYIVKMSQVLSSVELNDWESMKHLWKAWWKAGSFIWFYYWLFNILLIKEIDRSITRYALFLTVVILIVITMADNNIHSFGEYFANTNPVVVQLFWVLAVSLIMPLIFWVTWKPFFKKFECLGTLLAKAYQEKLSTNKSEELTPKP